MPFKCANCELCGREVEANLMCTIVMEDDKREKACWCVCEDCRKKFEENIDQPYKEQIADADQKKKG